MRVLLTAMLCEPTAGARNLQRHLYVLEQARAAGCALAVFPEMSLTGYIDPCDPRQPALTRESALIQRLVGATASTGVAALFGIAEHNPAGSGPFITQLLGAGGELRGAYRKQHLAPDETLFTAGRQPACFDLADGLRFGVAICADMDVDTAWDYAATQAADLVIHCAAPGLNGPRRSSTRDWQRGFDWWRGHCLAVDGAHVRRSGIPTAISTQAGAACNEDFPGWAALLQDDAEPRLQLPDWRPGSLVIDVP